MDDERDFICSVNWMDDGRHIAIGDTRCQVQIWDAERMKQVRLYTPNLQQHHLLEIDPSCFTAGSSSHWSHGSREFSCMERINAFKW